MENDLINKQGSEISGSDIHIEILDIQKAIIWLRFVGELGWFKKMFLIFFLILPSQKLVKDKKNSRENGAL